ncbi:hypothetical protein Poly59_20210 [Rubripirellula reticaptiva]|uniref:Uncharacterized protein n=1 Tax=Rubripirellula reticaptiva TaxID=2528013 RepID=A0A5C6F881_9BACT|nr:hypothetical protein Poly59_20210 [Rubripirellula reticaptiva]
MIVLAKFKTIETQMPVKNIKNKRVTGASGAVEAPVTSHRNVGHRSRATFPTMNLAGILIDGNIGEIQATDDANFKDHVCLRSFSSFSDLREELRDRSYAFPLSPVTVGTTQTLTLASTSLCK